MASIGTLESQANTSHTDGSDNDRTSLLHDNNISISYASTDNETENDSSSSKLDINNQHRKKKEEEEEVFSEIICDELNQITKLAIPVIGTYVLEMLPGVIALILVGQIQSDSTKEYIDAAAIAIMFINLTALSIGLGLASAMDTLCSQAYGANEIRKMGIFLQTGMIVLSVTYLFVFFVALYAAEILIALGQPERISRLAGAYILHLLPGIPFLYFYELLRKIMQSQNIVTPMLYIAIGGNVVNIIFGYYLIYYSSDGSGEPWWLGAAVSSMACEIMFLMFMMIYLYASDSWKLFWTGWDLSAACRGIPQFVSLGFPGTLQLCFEWWAFEILVLLCGLLPDAQVLIGANAILVNIMTLSYMFYYGISVACSTRIGNALGAGSANRASAAAKLSLGLACIMSILLGAALFVFRSSLPVLFTDDAEIGEYCSTLLYLAALFQFPDAINATVQGIFSGSGRQALGAKMNFVAYYLVGLPLAITLAFHFHQNLKGLWIGMTLSLFLVAAVGTFITVCRTDWNKLVNDAQDRVNN